MDDADDTAGDTAIATWGRGRLRKVARLSVASPILGGTTLVISPLISLMKDRVDELNRRGIPTTKTAIGRAMPGRVERPLTSGRESNHPSLASPLFRLLVWFAVILAAWALVVAVTGGYRGELFGMRVSVTSVWRPGIPALVIFVIYAWRAAPDALDKIRRIAAFVERRTPLLVAAAAAFAVAVASVWGLHTASGADSYGYVSQADLWLRRQLIIPRPLPDVRALTDSALSPLGYVAGQQPGTIVPLYPPGLPILMATGKILFGACGVYLVVPICAGLLVWMTYRLGSAVASRGTGLAAAVLIACSPVALFISTAPMSDVPASAVWAGAMVCLLRSGLPHAALAGLATGLTILIRPTLFPVALVGVLVLLLRARREGNARRMFKAIVVYSLATLPGILTIAIVNWNLYGSPLRSGYGDLSFLFAVRHATVNVPYWASWLMRSHTIGVAVAAVPLVLGISGHRDRWTLDLQVLMYGSMLAVASSYLFYRPFEEWWWLRFELPAFPALLVAMAAGGRTLIARAVPARFVAIAGILATVVLAVVQLRFAVREQVFQLWKQGTRTYALGRYIHDRMPANAIFFAGEQSGSIRVYGERLTIHLFGLQDLDNAVAAVKQAGLHPYLALESWEWSRFSERFLPSSRVATELRRPIAEIRGAVTLSVYDLSLPGPDRPETIPPAPRRCP